MASAAALSSSVGLSTCDEFLLSAEGGAGFLTEARAETGVPLAPDRTDRVLATPPAVPFVVGVDERVGVRFAAAGEDEETLEGVLRPGVPVAGGLFAVAVDMLYAVCSCVGSEVAVYANAVQEEDQQARCESPNGGPLAIVAAVELGLLRWPSHESGTLAFTRVVCCG